MKVKILKRPDVTDLAGEKVMIDFETGKYFMLTGAANEIWDLLADGVTISAIVDKLIEIYDVTYEDCWFHTAGFVKKLEQMGFVRLEDE